MKKYILIIFCFPALLFAENNGDSLKFEIIKATVNFYTTDSAAYYKYLNGKSVSCPTVDYTCIADFCTSNDVGSILKKVEDWKKESSNSLADLQKLAKKISDELQKKDYRKKLESFKKYNETIVKLIAAFNEAKTEKASVDNTESERGTKSKSPSTTIEDDKGSKSESTLPIIAIILGGIAFILGIVNFFKSKSAGSDKEVKSSPDYHILKEEVRDLKNRVAQKQSIDIKPLEDKLRNLEGRILNFENQPRVVELPVNYEAKKPETIQNAPPSASGLKYARYPDLSNGFTNGSLKDTQNGEHIYQITISGNNASFSIAEDTSAQVFALSDYKNYLMDACDFLNQPFKNCHIITVTPGSLSKSSGNWIIQTKAKIEFK